MTQGKVLTADALQWRLKRCDMCWLHMEEVKESHETLRAQVAELQRERDEAEVHIRNLLSQMENEFGLLKSTDAVVAACKFIHRKAVQSAE